MEPPETDPDKPTKISLKDRLDFLRHNIGLGSPQSAWSETFELIRFSDAETSEPHEHCDGCWSTISGNDWAWWSEEDVAWLCPECYAFLQGFEAGAAGSKP